MKNLIYLLICLGLLSCKKEKDDPCDTIICLNGGTCDDGTCICINGYSGQLCETAPDACAGITCVNGGICVNGVCNCPTGYTGGDCSLQDTPTRINITSITVTKFPAAGPGGSSWDLTNGADIYVNIALNGVTIAENPGDRYDNATSPPFSWNSLPNAFEFAQPTNQYTIRLYDGDDLDADDFMGGVNFTPYYDTNGFPDKLEIDCPTCDVAFELTLDYDF